MEINWVSTLMSYPGYWFLGGYLSAEDEMSVFYVPQTGHYFAQSAGAVEYTDSISAGVRKHPPTSELIWNWTIRL